MPKKTIAVIGAGASGLAASVEALRTAKSASAEVGVTLFERLQKSAKKLMVTGNGRCNFTNTDLSDAHFYGGTELLPNLKRAGVFDEQAFFATMGILTYCENGRVYPRSEQAFSVCDALTRTVGILGGEVLTEMRIDTVEVQNNQLLIGGRSFDAVIIACGGKASPVHGSDGSSFTLLKSFGHTIEEPFPALAALKSHDKLLPQLKGVRARAGLTLFSGKKELGFDEGELQFNADGISGIPALQLSHLCAEKHFLSASVDLCREIAADQLKDFLFNQKYTHPHAETEAVLGGLIHQKLGWAVMERCGIAPHTGYGTLTDREIVRLCGELKALRFEIDGTAGFLNAQISCGGARTDEFFADTLMSRKKRGLFVCGEALNLHGDCGGYNLHLAFATGRLAGKSAVNFVIEEKA